MTFPRPGLASTEPQPPRPKRKFTYQTHDGGAWHDIEANDIYFYEAGRVGFWNDDPQHPGERILVLATKAFATKEVINP